MKNQSINLGYNAQEQKFYIVINGVTGDDPIKDAVLALVRGVSGSAEIAAINGLSLEKAPVMDDDMTVAAEPAAEPEDTAVSDTVTPPVPADNEAPAEDTAPATDDTPAETGAAAETPVTDEPSGPSGEPVAQPEPVPESAPESEPSAGAPASAIFKMRAGVPLVGALVKAGKAVLNRADSTITVSDAKAIKDLAEAGLERIG